MNFIEHIVEPSRILLAWQSFREENRTRYIVAEINRTAENKVVLKYLPDTKDFEKAKEWGFESYPAFPYIEKVYDNVLDTFLSRLPPRKRKDFPEYLQNFRLKPDVEISDFALLGYSGANLLSDTFSIIHPFDDVKGACELLVEAAGFRHIQKEAPELMDIIQVDVPVFFREEYNETVKEDAVKIVITQGERKIGYVTRGLLPAFQSWIRQGRIIRACVEKKNGQPGKPVVYLYVEIAALTSS